MKLKHFFYRVKFGGTSVTKQLYSTTIFLIAQLFLVFSEKIARQLVIYASADLSCAIAH